MSNPNTFIINNDPNQLDVDLIHGFLSNSYWGKGRKHCEVVKSIQHSLNFGVYLEDQQIGFARVVTDYTLFAYLFDVFIVEEHRGKGYSKKLMQNIMDHPELQGIKHWKLGTYDAHGLYEQFGFTRIVKPEIHMEFNTVTDDGC